MYGWLKSILGTDGVTIKVNEQVTRISKEQDRRQRDIEAVERSEREIRISLVRDKVKDG